MGRYQLTINYSFNIFPLIIMCLFFKFLLWELGSGICVEVKKLTFWCQLSYMLKESLFFFCSWDLTRLTTTHILVPSSKQCNLITIGNIHRLGISFIVASRVSYMTWLSKVFLSKIFESSLEYFEMAIINKI